MPKLAVILTAVMLWINSSARDVSVTGILTDSVSNAKFQNSVISTAAWRFEESKIIAPKKGKRNQWVNWLKL